MSSLLSVHGDRRSRSKSPGGRDRDRDRSRDRSRSRDDRNRDRSPARPERDERNRRGSKYDDDDDSEEDSEEDYDRRRGKDKKSRSRRDEEDDDDDRRRGGKKSSRKAYDEDSDDEKYKSSKSGRSRRKDEDDEDDKRDRRRDKERRDRDRDVSDDERRSGRKEKEKERSRKKQAYESDSSDSDDGHASRKARDRKDAERMLNGAPAYAPAPPGAYGYPSGYGAPPPAQNGYQDARHMSYIPGDPRFAPAPGQYLPPGSAGTQRAGSFSGPSPGSRYAPPEQFQYARPGEIPGDYRRDAPRDDGKQYMKTYNAQGQPQMVEIKPAGGERERRRPEKDRRYDDDSSSEDGRRDRRDKRYNDDRYDRKDDRRDDRGGDRWERERERPRDDHRDRKEKDYHNDKYAPKEDLSKKLGKLAVGGAAGAATLGVAQHAMGGSGGGKPPASPLLEAYKGTYQSISPMPSALVLSKHGNDSDLSDLDLEDDSDIDPRDPNADLKRKIKKLEKQKVEHEKDRRAGKDRDRMKEISPRSSKEDDIQYQTVAPRGRADSNVSDMGAMVISPSSARKKRVMFYEADDDAKKIAAALEGTHRPANPKPLVQILPPLTDDDIMALRLAYKVSIGNVFCIPIY